MNHPVFYVPGQLHIVDDAVSIEGRALIGRYSRKTLDELQDEYPGVELHELDEVRERIEAQLISEPAEITEEQWMDALEVLPPEDWRGDKHAESFKFCEYYSGRVTTCYVRVGTRYFAFKDIGSKTHNELTFKVIHFLQNQPKA